MKISIITATYNSEGTVSEAIESLGRQRYEDIEHVVVDGASADSTVQVIRDAARQPDVLVSEPDDGIYDALNKGIARASGDVIGFLHSDDLFRDPEVLSKVAAVFEETGCDAVFGDLEYVAAKDTDRVIRYWRGRTFSPSVLGWGWMPPHPTFFMTRRRYEELGGFDLSLRISADYDAVLRYLRNGIEAVYLPYVITRMRLGGVSNDSMRGILEKTREDYEVVRRHDVGGAMTVACKNLRKLSQFWEKAG